MSKLQDQRDARKKAGETNELLDTLGSDSEDTGAKATIEYQKEFEKTVQKKELDFVTKLSDIKKKEVYYRSIYAEARLRALEFDPPKGFNWWFHISKDGLALIIQSPTGQRYGHGMLVTGVPENDAKGIDALISKGLDYMDALTPPKLNGHSKQK